MAQDEKQQLALRMDNVAAELAGLKRTDPRWAEIVEELSRLSQLRASLKKQSTDG